MRRPASPSTLPIPHRVTHMSRMVAQRGQQMVCQQSATQMNPPWLKTLPSNHRQGLRKRRHIRPNGANHRRPACLHSNRLRLLHRCNKWPQQVKALLPPTHATSQPASANRCSKVHSWDSTSSSIGPSTMPTCNSRRSRQRIRHGNSSNNTSSRRSPACNHHQLAKQPRRCSGRQHTSTDHQPPTATSPPQAVCSNPPFVLQRSMPN